MMRGMPSVLQGGIQKIQRKIPAKENKKATKESGREISAAKKPRRRNGSRKRSAPELLGPIQELLDPFMTDIKFKEGSIGLLLEKYNPCDAEFLLIKLLDGLKRINDQEKRGAASTAVLREIIKNGNLAKRINKLSATLLRKILEIARDLPEEDDYLFIKWIALAKLKTIINKKLATETTTAPKKILDNLLKKLPTA